MKKSKDEVWPESDCEGRIDPCCKGTPLVPGRYWAASCEVIHYISQPPYHRPGPLIYTVCPAPIPKGSIFKVTFSASSAGQFDYYIHHGPHAGLKAICGTSRRKLHSSLKKGPNGQNAWATIETTGFFETTDDISAPYWCWFDPCYEITSGNPKCPVFGATLVVEMIRGPASAKSARSKLV